MFYDNRLQEFVRVAVMRFYIECQEKSNIKYYDDLLPDYSLDELLKFITSLFFCYAICSSEDLEKCHK